MTSYVLVSQAPEVRMKTIFPNMDFDMGLHGNISRFTTTDATEPPAEKIQKPNYTKFTKILVVWWIWYTVVDVMNIMIMRSKIPIKKHAFRFKAIRTITLLWNLFGNVKC